MKTDLLAAARHRTPTFLPLVACLLAAYPAAAALAADLAARPSAAPARSAIAAATSIVQNCNDTGSGSLRDAIAIADDGATIDMTALACSTITLATGRIFTTATSMTLNGPTDHMLTISGYHDRVLSHSGTGTLVLDHLKITNGDYAYIAVSIDGGCIRTNGDLTLRNSIVSNCAISAPGSLVRGGGIFVQGNLILNDSVISGNQASSPVVYGAGAFVFGTVTANRSTIRDNVAFGGSNSVGGGLYAHGNIHAYATTISANQSQYAAGIYAKADATVQNSTISGNTATAGAGGMKVNGILTLDNSTVAFNTQGRAGYGAGLDLVNGGIANSSIIARNKPAPGGHYYDLLCTTGKTLAGSNNLINGADCIIPGVIIFGDPLLAPLANNGGPTKTHALDVGSPAIDAGLNPHDFAFDQRLGGYPRVVGPAADVGAFEFNVDRIFANGFD